MPDVVIGPVNVGNVPPVIVIVMITDAGSLGFVLDRTAFDVSVGEDELKSKTELSSFLHPARIRNLLYKIEIYSYKMQH